MLLQHVGEDLQGKALLLSGLLAPLVRVHFGVGQVRVVVLVIWKARKGWGGRADTEMSQTRVCLPTFRFTVAAL